MAQFQTLSLHLLGGIEKNYHPPPPPPPPPKKPKTKPHIWFDNNVKAQEITVYKEQEDSVNRMR